MSDPAEKYRDQVNPEHEAAMQAIGLAHLLMNEHREHLARFLQARRDLDSFGHIVDPTLYRDVTSSRSMAQQVRLVEAALAFLREAKAVTDEVIKARGQPA
jgi:hypothetical protein